MKAAMYNNISILVFVFLHILVWGIRDRRRKDVDDKESIQTLKTPGRMLAGSSAGIALFMSSLYHVLYEEQFVADVADKYSWDWYTDTYEVTAVSTAAALSLVYLWSAWRPWPKTPFLQRYAYLVAYLATAAHLGCIYVIFESPKDVDVFNYSGMVAGVSMFTERLLVL
jgi:hypothetical protein